jgi:hypothetical protein
VTSDDPFLGRTPLLSQQGPPSTGPPASPANPLRPPTYALMFSYWVLDAGALDAYRILLLLVQTRPILYQGGKRPACPWTPLASYLPRTVRVLSGSSKVPALDDDRNKQRSIWSRLFLLLQRLRPGS